MPALIPTQFTAEVVWLGRVADSKKDLSAVPVEALDLSFGGDSGEYHSGLTRLSCGRVSALYERGTEIMNVRQLSIVSQEELDLIAKAMGLDALDPAWVGASIVLKGLPDLTHLPPSARLQGTGGVTLTVDMENRPCVLPARVIEAAQPGCGAKFKPAAKDRRGITAWVERPELLSRGDRMRLFVPGQRSWAHLDVARNT